MELKENERIDDLEFKGFKIIQNSEGFCFGIDAVLLSDFAKNIKNKSKVLDLGTGTGILPILLAGKTNVYDMAKRSIALNKLENRCEIINENILNLEKIYKKNSFDVIVTNPPYKENNTGLKNESEKKLISRHELTANLEDFIRVSSNLLKDKGELYMVHRPERLVDIIENLRKYKLEPKQIRFVCPNVNKEPNIVLIKGVKNANKFLKVEKNLFVYNENNEYTDEILKIYNKQK